MLYFTVVVHGRLIFPSLTGSPLARHPLAARDLAGHLLGPAVPVAGRVAVLGRGTHLGLAVRLVLLAGAGPGVGAC